MFHHYYRKSQSSSYQIRPKIVTRDSWVGTATRYGLDGPGFEARWGRDFPFLYRPALGFTQLPAKWTPEFFPGLKRLERGVYLPFPSSAEVKERAELYLFVPSGPSWAVLVSGLPFCIWTLHTHIFDTIHSTCMPLYIAPWWWPRRGRNM